MLEKRTVLDQIEIARDGTINVRFAKQIVEEGVALFSEPHRTTFPPNSDVEAQVIAVNDHLAQFLGYPEISSVDVHRISTIATAAWSL